MSRPFVYMLMAAGVVATFGAWVGSLGDHTVREEVVERYIEGIQSGDAELAWEAASARLRTAIEGAVDGGETGAPALDRFLELASDGFRRQRGTGWLRFDADGYALIQALGLRRGAFYQVTEQVDEGDTAYLRMHVVMNYGLMDRPDLARTGAVFHRLGQPFGSVYPTFHGVETVGDQTELFSVDIVWEIERELRPDGPVWTVAGVRPEPETAEFIEVVGPTIPSL